VISQNASLIKELEEPPAKMKTQAEVFKMNLQTSHRIKFDMEVELEKEFITTIWEMLEVWHPWFKKVLKVEVEIPKT
jgi:hypothetical protein